MPTPTSPTMLPTSPAPVTPTNPLNAKPTDTTYAAYEASQGFPQATKPADVTAIQPNQNNGSTSPTPQQQKANSNPQGTTVSNPYGAAGTSPQYTDSNGNPYYMQGNTLVYGTIPGSSPSSAGLPGTTSTGNPNVDALNASYKAQADAATKFANAVTGIENGSIPLNAGEQAQIDGLKQQFQALIDKQNLVNTSNTNTAWTLGYASGASEYSPTYQANIIGDVIQMAKFLSRLVITAAYMKPIEVPFGRMLTSEMTITTAVGYPTEMPEVIAAMPRLKDKIAAMISHRLPLSQVMEGLKIAATPQSNKVMINCDEGAA